MAAIVFVFVFSLLLLLSAAALGFTRTDFPPDFVFGAATSSYQYEGAVDEDGRSPGIWDTFTHAGRLSDKSTGDVASDGYHRYKDDVKLMADTNLEAYRFSISWSRLIPDGRGTVNPKGLEYYNNLIDELVKHGIQVHVMLHHLDFPQVLEDVYGGWLSPRIVEDFTTFADVCFREFGDRVSYWTTIDEPNVGVIGSYDTGIFAPGHCSDPFGLIECIVGDSTVEPYVAAHNMILAHASATRLYRKKYQATQKGLVGINVYSFWTYPLTNSTADLQATERYQDFVFGWVLGPLVFGDYPQVMKKNVGSRLPSFTKFQSEAIKGAIDFIGINHYFSIYVNDRPLDEGPRDYEADMSVYQRGSRTDPPSGQVKFRRCLSEILLLTARNSDPTGDTENTYAYFLRRRKLHLKLIDTTLISHGVQFNPEDFPNDPDGLQFVLQYLTEAYGGLPIYVHENGDASDNDVLDDTDRLEYLKSYIGSALAAVRNGANLKGYFVWSFLDLFEFLGGYNSGYGLYRVEFGDKALPRQARLSARWYSDFLKKKKDSGSVHVQ